jgi:YNFM family putative membrane transporter
MTGRLLTGVLTDLFSWRPALAAIGAIGIAASVIFSSSLPASARFRPRSLSIASLLDSYRAHLRDGIILALVAEAFLILGTLVTVYNYTAFRLVAPPYSLSQSIVGAVFGLYLLGFFSSSLIGLLSHRFSRPNLLKASLATMLAGVAITAAHPLAAVITGIGLVTIGFFGAQSVASTWVGIRAREAKAQASALYLFFYYMGSSLAGSVGGFFWTAYGWNGVAAFLSVLLLVALAIANTRLNHDDTKNSPS